MALRKLGIPDKVISLVKAFHQGMRAMVRLEGMNMEGVSVQNGLRQGCCMAPMLFNLYTCLVMERWMARVEGAEGVGVTIKHKYDGRLFK